VTGDDLSFTYPGPEPAEELIEGVPTGLEAEPEPPEPVIEKPWNPNDIRVDSKNFALRNILDMIRDDDLDLAPDFQRRLVWGKLQKSRLVESILLRIPLPAFYFTQETDGMMRVVDGLQRLSTINEFTGGAASRDRNFRLGGLEYLQEVEGKTFANLAPSWQRRLLNTQIFVHVIDPRTPDPLKFDIFKRINTGGSPLNAQEIRHCMSGPLARALLKRCVDSSEFSRATNGALHEHKRMMDRELALRFCAFRMLNEVEEYAAFGTMDAFLTAANRRLEELSENNREILFLAFQRAMISANLLFGVHAFRKWYLNNDFLYPINRALFETWSVALSNHDWDTLAASKEVLALEARKMMTDDREYLEAISVSTGDRRRVSTRFRRVADTVSKYASD
jgi:hypothetical protein